MPTETFEQALAKLDTGELDGARAIARPMLSNPDARANGIYILGRAYQLEGKPHIALYLFEQAAGRVCPPDTATRLAECKAGVDASGWTEDFAGRGHTLCPACRLYYRAENAACPYCSGEKPAEPADNQYAHVIGNEDLGWKDDLLDKAEKAGRDVLGKAKEIADSKSVKEMAERARTIGKEAGESVRKMLDSETAKEVQETTRETGRSVSQHLRAFIDEERSRYEAADQTRKRAIMVKWILAGFAALVALQALAWVL